MTQPPRRPGRIRAALLALALTAPLLAAMSAPAAAATVNEPLVYQGTRTGHTIVPGGVDQPIDPEERTVTLTCEAGRCSLDGLDPVTRDEVLVLVDGAGSFTYPATGTACDDPNTRAEQIDLVATATSLTGTIAVSGQGPDQCGDVQITRTGTFLSYDLALVSGDPCALDDSCVRAEPSPTATAGAEDAGAPTGRGDLATPSVLSALPTVAEGAAVRNLAWAALGALVLVVLVALPTALFDSAVDNAMTRLSAWWRKRRGLPPAAGGEREPLRVRGFFAAAAGVVVAALISGFVDPSFGVEPTSFRVALSMLVSFGITFVLGWFALIAIVRRAHPKVSTTFEFVPLSLIVVVLAVVLARISGFQPAIVFGAVAGVVFAGLTSVPDKARHTLLTVGYSFALAILGWIGYSLLAGAGAAPLVFLRETLSGLTVAGIAALPLILLPLRGLPGGTIWRWRRWVWAVVFGTGLFAFLLILLPLPAAWDRVGLGIWAWGGLFAAYAIASVVLWAVFRPKRTPA